MSNPENDFYIDQEMGAELELIESSVEQVQEEENFLPEPAEVVLINKRYKAIERFMDQVALDDDWKKQAVCKGLTYLFFPPQKTETPTVREARESQAQRLCNGCPVQYECDQAAIAKREFDIWGGRGNRDRYTFNGIRLNTYSNVYYQTPGTVEPVEEPKRRRKAS